MGEIKEEACFFLSNTSINCLRDHGRQNIYEQITEHLIDLTTLIIIKYVIDVTVKAYFGVVSNLRIRLVRIQNNSDVLPLPMLDFDLHLDLYTL